MQDVEDITLIRSISKVSHGESLLRDQSKDHLRKKQKYSKLVSAVYRGGRDYREVNSVTTIGAHKEKDLLKQDHIKKKM